MDVIELVEEGLDRTILAQEVGENEALEHDEAGNSPLRHLTLVRAATREAVATLDLQGKAFRRGL